ncbi:DUF2125 domain-containing protein [Paracoccus sp. N5]|uniref:DUF2125 domain-containing protein n=1 Tax=Paracoccus sp. N5 TaxID=1101189 RepID=UPI0003A20C3B|nr:DUF2125 domain-containing protein [Paracoccus sp. N5]
MRRLLLWLTVLALALGGLWLGAEGLLVRELRRFAAETPGVGIGTLHELRRPGRIGVSAVAVELETPSGRLALPQAQAWVGPLHPTELRLDLPPQAVLDAGAGAMVLGLTDAEAGLGVRPLAGAEFRSVFARSGPLTLEGAPLAQGLDARARLADDGGYDVALSLHDLAPEALSNPLPLPGKLSLKATGRLWLDRPPSPQTLTPETMPLPTGLRLDGSELRLGKLGARILGEVHADAQGRAQGLLAVYTPDARPMLEAAAAAGLIPQKVVMLAGAMLKNISELPLPEGADFPAPASGELRLPLILADGKVSLGPVTLGPAPVFPRR